MKKSHKFLAPTAIALLTLVNLAPVAIAYPGNRERYDCYRKSDNQFSFGSPTNVSNRTTICTPNPNYRYQRPSRRTTPTTNRSSTSNRSRTVYRNVYRRDNTSEKIAIGLGSFVFGAFIGSALWGGLGLGLGRLGVQIVVLLETLVGEPKLNWLSLLR